MTDIAKEKLEEIAQVLSQLDEQELENATPYIEGLAAGFKMAKLLEDKKKEKKNNG
nr:MAG TPA: hypothetical protein [Caudoviricetes sp.]